MEKAKKIREITNAETEILVWLIDDIKKGKITNQLLIKTLNDRRCMLNDIARIVEGKI